MIFSPTCFRQQQPMIIIRQRFGKVLYQWKVSISQDFGEVSILLTQPSILLSLASIFFREVKRFKVWIIFWFILLKFFHSSWERFGLLLCFLRFYICASIHKLTAWFYPVKIISIHVYNNNPSISRGQNSCIHCIHAPIFLVLGT